MAVARNKPRKKPPAAVRHLKKPPKSVTAVRVRLEHLRSQAMQDYVTDPERRTISWWHKCPDRSYHDAVSANVFSNWASKDSWTEQRQAFWEDLECRVIEERKHQLLRERLNALALLTPARNLAAEYLLPLRDPDTGDIKRYPADHPHYPGLPMMSLPLGRYDQTVRALIALDQHLMTLRGEVTQRAEIVTRKAGEALDPLAHAVALKQEDVQTMAKALLRQRQPNLELEAEWEDITDSAQEQSDDDGQASEG